MTEEPWPWGEIYRAFHRGYREGKIWGSIYTMIAIREDQEHTRGRARVRK